MADTMTLSGDDNYLCKHHSTGDFLPQTFPIEYTFQQKSCHFCFIKHGTFNTINGKKQELAYEELFLARKTISAEQVFEKKLYFGGAGMPHD